MSLPRIAAVAALVAGSLALGLSPTAAGAGSIAERPTHRGDDAAVFVQTNNEAGNSILVFARGHDGRLTEAGEYATGGRGGSEPGAVVDPLASQGSLTYDAAHRLLYAVNAGSNTLTVFEVHGRSLARRQVLATNGILPVSVSRSGDLVYVLDAGGDGAITGFRIHGDRLRPIPGSTRSLGLGNPAAPPFLSSPSQVAITPDARAVIVATKTHGDLLAFPLDRAGHPAAHPVVTATPDGVVPFALTFDRAGRLQVADAKGGASSYAVRSDGTLSAISPFVANGQAATCWSVNAKGYLFVANAGSATITGYTVDRSGRLSLHDPTGVTARTDAGPVDLAVSGDGNFLYQQATGAGAIDEFRVGDDGSLHSIGSVAGLPADQGHGFEGIAAN
ncbi:lactonase family protein [Nakamurella lactea]|uniref:lactonase family protein n=1 Tax=Nakamurella lactea TaxID=459515 RepID=UPI000402C289|nr:hypothetical protein [Nakamurella lactea]